MLETFTLKQHLDTTRQELSQALYQHDAACRVIARLMKERDEARAALTNLQANGHNVAVAASAGAREAREAPAADHSMDVESASSSAAASGNKLSTQVLEKINETCASLSAGRKSRKPVAEGHLSRESMASVKNIAHTYSPHSSTKGAIHAMALSPADSGRLVLTGGADKDVLLSDKSNGKVYARLSGHSKKVTSVAFHPSARSAIKFSSSADRSVKIWSVPSAEVDGPAGTFEAIASLEGHASDVNAISVHPSG